ncbi:imidazole glycerol phosphate synthase subunit HisH [Candidatus Pelagibacter sp.]|jgi:imidazole glycerol-phosphate synthase subunit HisH|nr:imidazole glycerol phosphate synthase subunit HisH [Candidatus Pelagibacter sp.]
MSKIVIVDYSCGNIDSVNSAITYHGFKGVVTRDPKIINNADKIILPGQGSFKIGVNNLKKYNLFDLIISKALNDNTPILGICLGMQVLATMGFENGKENGLNLIPGNIEKMKETKLKLPHIGWNEIEISKESPILKDIKNQTDFYFVHSYKFVCEDNDDILTTTKYEDTFVSSVCKKNIFGVQFHPEKSLTAGLQLIKNFIDIKC